MHTKWWLFCFTLIGPFRFRLDADDQLLFFVVLVFQNKQNETNESGCSSERASADVTRALGRLRLDLDLDADVLLDEVAQLGGGHQQRFLFLGRWLAEALDRHAPLLFDQLDAVRPHGATWNASSGQWRASERVPRYAETCSIDYRFDGTRNSSIFAHFRLSLAT